MRLTQPAHVEDVLEARSGDTRAEELNTQHLLRTSQQHWGPRMVKPTLQPEKQPQIFRVPNQVLTIQVRLVAQSGLKWKLDGASGEGRSRSSGPEAGRILSSVPLRREQGWASQARLQSNVTRVGRWLRRVSSALSLRLLGGGAWEAGPYG